MRSYTQALISEQLQKHKFAELYSVNGGARVCRGVRGGQTTHPQPHQCQTVQLQTGAGGGARAWMRPLHTAHARELCTWQLNNQIS